MWLKCLVFLTMIVAYYCEDEYYIDDKYCILASKNNSIIDLSRANSIGVDDETGHTVVINLCKKHKRKRDCPKESLVCLIEVNTNKTVDIGSRITNITFDGQSFHLSIKSKFGKGTISIICSDISSIPIAQNIQTDPIYKYDVVWLSTSACPQKHYKTVNKCILYTKEHSFDLRPLQYSLDPDYVVNLKPDLEFVIAICKKVSHPQCSLSAVCNRASNQPIAKVKDYALEFITNRGLFISYNNSKGNGKTVINFICSENATKPVIHFDEEYEGDYFFKMTTSAVCPSQKNNCLVPDNDKKYFYDLENLHKFNDNYQHILENGQKIIFNICGFLNYIPHVPCTGRKYFACIIDEQNKTLAFANSNKEPQFVATGNISLVFTGQQKNQEKFLLNVTIECSSIQDKQLGVQKINASFYSVHWKSGVACPSYIDRGRDCEVMDLYTNTMINLKQIHRKDKDYFVEHQDESFRINVCGNLNRACSQNAGASVCYKNMYGKELSIGEIGNKEPIFKDGQYKFVLEGEPCNERVMRSKVIIILSCEYFEDSFHKKKFYTSNPEFFVKENGLAMGSSKSLDAVNVFMDFIEQHYLMSSRNPYHEYIHVYYRYVYDIFTGECEFYFHWRTNIVCKDPASSNCSLVVDNKSFNLSSLKNLKENYVVKLNSSAQIVLNVCHSVIHDHRMRCLPGSGVCLINNSVDYLLSKDYDKMKMHESLGKVSVSGNLEYVNGSLRLSYKNGGICEDLSSVSGSHETTINFICNETVNQTELIYKGSKMCDYKFDWITNAACPIGPPATATIRPEQVIKGEDITPEPIHKKRLIPSETKSKIDVKNNNGCIVIDPETNKKFDLSALMSRSWKVINKDVNITISVCRPINNSFCHKDSGACSYGIDQNSKYRFYDIGDYNMDLTYEQGSLFLQYRTSGHIMTKIEFVCSMMDLGPKFIKKKEIQEGFITYISWPTQLACNKDVEVNCCQNIKTLCDHYNGTYQVNIDGKRSAFLSLCRPVIPKTGLHCTNNTPACIGVYNSDHSFSNEKILGRIHQQPVVLKDKSVTLEYISGSVCDSSLNTKYSTLIRFFCNDNSSDIYPKLHNVDEKNCRFSFDWGTALLCNESKPKKEKNCTFFGHTYAVDELQVDKLIGIQGTYSFNLCHPSLRCESSLCKSTRNGPWYKFGVKNNTKFIQEDLNSKIVITYLSPEKNGIKKCGAIVEILCDRSFSSFEDPVLKKETDCFIDVLIKHKLACPQTVQKQEIDQPQEGSSSLVWIAVLGLFFILSIVFVYVWLKRRRVGLTPIINRIFRYKVLENGSLGSMAMDSSADESTIIFELNTKNK